VTEKNKGQNKDVRTKQGYLDAFAPAQADPDGPATTSSSELGVILSLDGVFFFAVAFLADARGGRQFAKS
jgi:hypothetical protein